MPRFGLSFGDDAGRAAGDGATALVVRGSRVRQRFFLLGILLVAAIVATDALIIRMQRTAAIEDFRTATTNLANGMAAQTGRALGAIDRAMLETRVGLLPMAARGPAGLGTPNAAGLLSALGQRLDFVDAAIVLDQDGRVAAAPMGPKLGTDFSTLDLFVQCRAAASDDVLVGAPMPGGRRGALDSFFARRLTDWRGAFAGVVLARVSLNGLEDFYHTAMPRFRTVTLARRDGTVLVRYPHEAGAAGRRIPTDAAWYQEVAAGGGSYVAPGYFDPAPVVAVVRPLRGLPLVLEASTSEADALAGWRRQTIWLAAGGGVACAATVILVWLFALQLQRLAVRNAQLDAARGQLDAAMSNMSQGLCFFDGNMRLIVCNRRYGEMYGLPPDAMRPGTSLADIVACCYEAGGCVDFARDDLVMARAATARARAPHHMLLNMADGRTISVQQQPMPDGGWVATHEDITERRRAEEKVSYLARHDPLTGLANRAVLLERIGQASAHAGRWPSFAVLFLDLDRFKAVNDTLGHAAGDELLRAVTARLQAQVRDNDMVARLGGDEFVVLQTGVRAAEDAAALAGRIIEAVRAPYVIGDTEVVIGVSIGIDIGTSDRAAAADLLKNADMALYIAKAEGRGTFRFFAPDMDADMVRRHTLERDLRCAMARDEFVLHYQPIVDAQSGIATSFEAMLRWNHPQRGLIGPEEFLAVAEDTGVIIPIGQWAIEQACHQAASWPENTRVTLNVSPVQFRAANLVDVVRDALATAGVAPGRLELEITEAVLLQSGERNMAVLHALRAHGVRIALDHFGVGYSSLAHMRGFPFDRVKIDPAFVCDLTARQDAVHFVRAIVGLCGNLGIRTTADGVESTEQLAVLVGDGCSEAQGPLFSRPRPADRLAGFLGGARLMAEKNVLF